MQEFADEKYLFDEIKQGSHKAFEYLFKAYQPRLYRYAIRFVKDADMARDIVQECYLHLWEKRDLLQRVSLTSLLFTMVNNGCLNYLKHKSIVDNYKFEYLSNIDGEERLYQADFTMSSEYHLLYNELQEQIQYVIDKLPKRSKEIFLMSRFQGLKNREIADRLHISTTAVEKHLSKAMKSFSIYFKKEYPTELCIVILCFLSGI
jgi:RNA polymerase sigma-70 factor (ECF subfamily)